MSVCRKPYSSDINDEEWSLIVPYLLLQREDAGQREHDLREVFNGLRYIVKTGAPWRWMPNDLPPWAAVYQQTQRWLAAGCFEAMVDDLRGVYATGRRTPGRTQCRHHRHSDAAIGARDRGTRRL